MLVPATVLMVPLIVKVDPEEAFVGMLVITVVVPVTVLPIHAQSSVSWRCGQFVTPS
jgi:hypothetical protein